MSDISLSPLSRIILREVQQRQTISDQSSIFDSENPSEAPLDLELTKVTAVPGLHYGRMTSVFIANIFLDLQPSKILIQKVQKKWKKGFPSGNIQPGESILEAAIRENREETCLNIGQYDPRILADFTVANAEFGEKAAIVVVNLPLSEKENIELGSGMPGENEIITGLWLASRDDLQRLIQAGDLGDNSVSVVKILTDKGLF